MYKYNGRLEDGMGKIKEGLGAVIGNAGEYLVVGELLRRGIIAAPAPRNNPGYDVLATNGVKSINIRVKTKTNAADSWVWMCKGDGTIFKHLVENMDITILVDLKDDKESPDYFVVDTQDLNARLNEIHLYWLSHPGRNGKLRNAKSRMRRIGFTPGHKDWLMKHKGAWEAIINKLDN